METASPRRCDPLDALRGLSILLMVFSGRIPYGILPDWMYHAQVPPPFHKFDPSIPGITWVDLVFPFFLFSMGAAIPLALTRRLQSGNGSLLLGILKRSLTLAFFAIYVQHIKPWTMAADATGAPLWSSWALCLTGFLLLFPALAALPRGWPRWLVHVARLTGWGGMIMILSFVRYADGTGFQLERSDIIILVLANVYLTGATLWLLTRANLLPRLAVLAMLAGLILSARTEGWIATFWGTNPLPWLFRWEFQKYLFLVLPGTIIGDILLRWMSDSTTILQNRKTYTEHLGWILPILLNLAVVIGLKQRELLLTSAAAILLMIAIRRVFNDMGDRWMVTLRALADWGMALLLIGLACEPFEGGIRKDHPTFSYYFVTGGLAIYSLIAFLVLMERFGLRKPLRFLVDSGQNPLIAYAGVHSLVPPLLGIIGLYDHLERVTPGAWPGVVRGGLLTYLKALAASLCTRLGIRLKT